MGLMATASKTGLARRKHGTLNTYRRLATTAGPQGMEVRFKRAMLPTNLHRLESEPCSYVLGTKKRGKNLGISGLFVQTTHREVFFGVSYLRVLIEFWVVAAEVQRARFCRKRHGVVGRTPLRRFRFGRQRSHCGGSQR